MKSQSRDTECTESNFIQHSRRRAYSFVNRVIKLRLGTNESHENVSSYLAKNPDEILATEVPISLAMPISLAPLILIRILT